MMGRNESDKLSPAPPFDFVEIEQNLSERKMSLETKFEGPRVTEALKSEVNAAAGQRLQRRPSWNVKFEGPARSELADLMKVSGLTVSEDSVQAWATSH